MWWAMAATVGVGVAVGLLVRDIRANRRRIARLENELAAIGEAERIIARAHRRRDRSHLKLLGLIPIGWLVGSRARLAMASAASAVVVGAGFTATDTPLDSPPGSPPAAAEEPPAVVDTPVRAHGDPPVPSVPPSTTTTAAVSSPAPAAAVETGPASQQQPPPAAPAPSTTTTTLPIQVEVELPRPCLIDVPADLPLCQ